MNSNDALSGPDASVPVLPLAQLIEDLLDECERSSADGRHREGADQAEEVLASPGVSAEQQARAREMLALHRLRLGDFAASVQHGLLALEFLSASGDRLRESKVHCTMALAFTDTGLNEPALRHVLAALEAARACGSRVAEFWALSRSSMVHGAMGDSPRAVELGLQALVLARTLDDREADFVGLNNLADTLLESAKSKRAQGLGAAPELSDALTHIRDAVAVAQAQGHSFYETIARTNLVSILIELDQLAEAREEACRAKLLAHTHGFRNLEVNNDAQLAEVVRAEGRLDEAISMMEAQLADPACEDDPALLTTLRRSLFEIYKERGRFEEALRQHEELHSLTLRATVQSAGLQARIMINTLKVEEARHEAERSQLEAQMQRIRAEEMEDKAHTDLLTRLPNRRALDRELPSLMKRTQDRSEPLCAAMIDFDQFKRVNDNHGHATGDAVLTVMGVLLRAVIRDGDFAARVGGEEFMLIFGGTSLEGAASACERLLASVRTYPWGELAAGLSCTVSVGVAALDPNESVSHWLARADAALYAAKRGGRNQVITHGTQAA